MVIRVLLTLVVVLYLEPQNTSNANLLFSDEFSEDSLDLNKWSYELGDGCPNLCGWGNNERQVYSKKNISKSHIGNEVYYFFYLLYHYYLLD